MPCIDPLALLIRGGISAIDGDEESARRHLQAATDGFEAANMRLYAAAGRQRLGQVTGGEEGAHLMQQAEQVMREQRIPKPERMNAVMAPGFGDEA